MNVRLAVTVFALVLTVPLHAVDPHHPILSKNLSQQTPVWVPATEAVTDAGELNEKNIQKGHTWSIFERQAQPSNIDPASSNEPCPGITVFVDAPGELHIPASLDALARASKTVVVGMVMDVTPGFFDGLPASLVHVSAERHLRNAADSVYFVYPVARFSAGGRTFCRKNLLYGETIPSIGDSLLLFGNATIDRDDKVFAPLPHEVVIEHQGHLIVPPDLARDVELQSLSTMSALTERIQRRLAQVPQ
jgi:hypothetical protein